MPYNERMQIVVDTLLTHYVQQGKGKTVVVLHGWADSAAGLTSLSAELAKKFEVIALDLPGFGMTGASEAVWGLDDYTQFVAHFLHKLGVKKVHALVGHSNGGALAIRGLASGVLQADKLVLLASAGIRTPQSTRNQLLKMIAKSGKMLVAPLPKNVKGKLRRKLYAAAGSDMLVAEHMQETFKRVVGQDVRDDAAKLVLPTLLIYGSADTSTPPKFGEEFNQRIEGSQLIVIPGAGHFVHLDAAPQVITAIKEFLS